MPVVFHVEFTAGSDLGKIKLLMAGDEEGGGGEERTTILGRKNANIANGHNTKRCKLGMERDVSAEVTQKS